MKQIRESNSTLTPNVKNEMADQTLNEEPYPLVNESNFFYFFMDPDP